ncbi:MAG: hypothetical protein C5B50_10015 [Verrucomicrobia bacterium]|nr:MAG: hypothetical protein C5B50_10015 [Verrucomicrobiota bacterium]
MNAYLFTGLRSQLWQGQTSEACVSLIIYGGEEEASRKAFENWVLSPNYEENPVPTEVIKIIGAPILEQLLTETESTLINWNEICQEVRENLEETADDTGQGYWVDCDCYVKTGILSPNIESLRRDLPEEVTSDLNWSFDKTYYFLISVLTPPAPPTAYLEEPLGEQTSSNEDMKEQDAENPVGSEIAAYEQAFPELAGRELAVLVRARNAVVAAWLWRRHALTLPAGGHPIRVDAWCGAMSIEESV